MNERRAPTIIVVDDDDSIRQSLERALVEAGYSVASYASPRAFLERAPDGPSGCLVLDLRLPEMSGIELQRTLEQTDPSLPIVFISGEAGVPDAVQAMKGGAVDFLSKPFRRAELLEAVARAVARSDADRVSLSERRAALERYRTLSAQEVRVCRLVAAGLLSKQIAGEVGLAESTVRLYRSRLMHKLRIDSVPALMRLLAQVDSGS